MLTSLSPSAWTRDHAAHLLRRAGFGAPPEEVDQWHQLGLKDAVRRLVYWQDQPEFGSQPDWLDSYSTENVREAFRKSRNLPEEERQKARMEFNRERVRHIRELKSWWLERIILTPRPLEEKMTLFWHGHFVSSASKVRNPHLLWGQQQTFRSLGNKNFRDLAVAIGRDPAMLIYLDGNNSKNKAPNENYARELMELFTLGEGHYTEDDVREAARAFTGWGVPRFENESRFLESVFDGDRKSILGQSGKFNDEDVVDVILDQDQAGRFLAAKLWSYFVSEKPAPELIDYLGRTLKQMDYELAPILEMLFRSETFYAPEHRNKQIKSPTEWLAGLIRTLPVHRIPHRLGPQILKQMGQDLFEPPSVKGWEGGRSWINTTTLLLRMNIAKVLVYGGNGSELGIGGNMKELAAEIRESLPAHVLGAMKERSQRLNNRRIPSMIQWNHVQQQWPDIRQSGGRQQFAGSLLGFSPGKKLTADIETYFQTHPIRSGSPASQKHFMDLTYLVLSHPEYQLA